MMPEQIIEPGTLTVHDSRGVTDPTEARTLLRAAQKERA